MVFNFSDSISMYFQAFNPKSKLLCLCILLLNYAIPTLQVDISMIQTTLDQICQDILPGVCCAMVPDFFDYPPPAFLTFNSATWRLTILPLYGQEMEICFTHLTQIRYPSVAALEHHGKHDGVPELGQSVVETNTETR